MSRQKMHSNRFKQVRYALESGGINPRHTMYTVRDHMNGGSIVLTPDCGRAIYQEVKRVHFARAT